MMTNLNDREIGLLNLALRSLKSEVNSSIDELVVKLSAAHLPLKADGTPKKRPGRPLGRKNNKKPVVKKVTPVELKEAA